MKYLLLLLLCLSPVTINAQNWPSFRGPNASGIAEGTKPPVNWDVEKSQNVLWKTPIPGLSHASPIVWGNRVFVITAVSSDAAAGFVAKDKGIGLATDEAKHSWMIYALDSKNGKVVWSNTAFEGVPRAKRHVKATQANSTPVTDGRYVVALFGSEGLACYNFKDGKLVWKQDLGVLNPGLWDDKESSWGHSSSPIIYRDLAIVQADGHKQSFIAAYNLKDGKQAWRVERNEITSWTTPTIYEGKRTELIANGGRYIRGYDPLTGKELWRFADSDTQVKMQAPLVANDLIYITGGYPPGRAMYAFRPGAVGDISLKAGETKNEFLAWSTANGSPYTPTPLIYGDVLYALADNGVLSAYDAKTGERLYQQRLASTFSASPVAADGKLYLASEDGDVFVVKAGRQYELVTKNTMGQPLMATPAISDGMLIIRGEKTIYAIGQR